MKQNVGTIDKVVRLLMAMVFGVLYFTQTVSGTAGIILLVLGGVFAFTAILGTCPLYSLFGLSTCPVKK